MEKKSNAKHVGTLSADEWEMAGLYLALAYEKVEPPRESRPKEREDRKRRRDKSHESRSRESSRSSRHRDSRKSESSSGSKRAKKGNSWYLSLIKLEKKLSQGGVPQVGPG